MNQVSESSTVSQPRVHERSSEVVASSVVDQHLVEQPGPTQSVARRLVKTLLLIVALIGGGIFGMYKMHVNIPLLNTPRIYASLDTMGTRVEQIKGQIVAKYESHFHKPEEEVQHEEHHILVTSPMAKDVVITQDYVCLIRSQQHIDVCAMESGYLKTIPIKEGQAVKAGDLMFEVMPILYKARLDAEVAERDLAQLEYKYTQTLADKQGVSQKEVFLYKAKLAKAQAKVDLAEAEMNFAKITAPFDGIVDRQKEQKGSLIKEGDILTTLSDNSVMRCYFNVTERRYLEYMAETDHNKQSPDIELRLADQTKFPEVGKIAAIESNFNPETGNIAFRADFPNPNGLLRHGQTGTVLINRVLKGANVIPQRATFENLAKRYVYVVGKDGVAHQREITIEHVLDDIFVIGKQIGANDKIVLEGTRQVKDGQKVEGEFRDPELVIKDLKNKAE